MARARLGGRTLSVAVALTVLATGMSACGDSDGDAADTAPDTVAPGRSQDDAAKTSKPRERQKAAAGTKTQTQAQAQHDRDDRRQDGADGTHSGGVRTKRSEPRKKVATRVALRGEAGEARAALGAVGGAYDDLARAVRGGVADVNLSAAATLEAAEGNSALARVCQLMSEEAKRQAIDYARRSAGLTNVDWTCEKATGLMLRRTRQHRALERTLGAEVVGVNAEGDRATATVRFGGAKRPLSTIPLVKEDGQWKLGTSLDQGV